MGDVKKDVDALLKMEAAGEDTIRIAFDLNRSLIKLFIQRIKKQHGKLSKKQLMEKVSEELFYGRNDNP